MATRLTVSQILEAGAVALVAGIAAEARHREFVRIVLDESRYLRTHLPDAPEDEIRTSIEVMLRRVDQARDNHRRQNWTIARLQDLLDRARRCQNEPDKELVVSPNLFELLSPFLELGGLSYCKCSEDRLRHAVRSRSLDQDGIVGYLKALCATPNLRF